MAPFASTELARDSPLDELAVRHSLSSVSLSSISSSPRPGSLPILDAFPLPVNSDYETADQHDGYNSVSSTASSRTGTPSPLDTAGRTTSDFSSTIGLDDAVDIRAVQQPSVIQTPRIKSVPNPQSAKHTRDLSTDTILPAPDHVLLSSPLSRTQERYQRYGHRYSGSQGHMSPGTSPVKSIPPALGPTWRSLGLAPNSAPNSAVSTTAEPTFSSFPRGHSPPRLLHPIGAAHVNGRLPTQATGLNAFPPSIPSGTYSSLSPASTSGSSVSVSNFDNSVTGSTSSHSTFSHAMPMTSLQAHGSSQSWDMNSNTRVQIPILPSAAHHLWEGSAALSVDSRLTLEHWAAAASRFGSSAGNLLLELGWSERWIPWTIISGLDLPVKVHEVDLAELKYGVAPCKGRIADALHSYGVRLRVRQQEAAALRVFELAESLGSTEAAFSAAQLCMKGGRQVKRDMVKARNLLRRVNDI